MRIGGFQKFTMSDFPGHISAILFTTGCNFRCPYCHNPELVLPERFRPDINIEEIFAFLDRRAGKLDGVVITGGEPTLHNDLPDLIQDIKNLGYDVKLDTNGTNPEMIYELFQKGLLDYVAMDYKAPAKKFYRVAGIDDYNNYFQKIQETLVLLITSNIDYEIRTTVAEDLLDAKDIKRIREEIGSVKKHYLQKYEPGKTLDPNLSGRTQESNIDLKKLAGKMENVFIR